MSRRPSRGPEKGWDRTILKCDAWVASVMGKMYSFCSMVLNHLLRTCTVAPGAEPPLCVAQRHYVCGWCWLFIFGALLCLSPAWLLHILMVDSWFTAGRLKQSVVSMEVGKTEGILGGSHMPESMWGISACGERSVRAAMWWEETMSWPISFYSQRWLV